MSPNQRTPSSVKPKTVAKSSKRSSSLPPAEPMIDVRRIVVAVDNSPDSLRALPISIRLAERTGIALEIIGAVDQPQDVGTLRDRLAIIVRESGPIVRASSVVESTDVPRELARQARALPGSIIVMSSHGPSRNPWTLSNSIATEILSEGVPLMIVGPHAIAGNVNLPVVACIDDSADSEAAIPIAVGWARLLRVPLILLTVDRPHLQHVPPNSPTIADTFDGGRATELASETRLTWPDIDVRCHLATYPWMVADALVLYLAKHPSQLFVAASHVRTGLARLLHPTTTGQIVRVLAAPVLVVPVLPHPIDTPDRTSSPSAIAHPFGHVIVPVGHHQPLVDACIATANNLAVGGGGSIMLLTCDQDADRIRRQDPARSELLTLLSPTDARWHVVDTADVTGTVIAEAEAHEASIICLATHAQGRVVDTLLPTVTGQLVRWSPRPVVLVGPHCVPTAEPYAEMVACIDGSQISEAVADLAGSWAAVLGAPMRILHVTDPRTVVAGAAPLASRYVERLAGRVATAHGVYSHVTMLNDRSAAKAIVRWAEVHPTTLLMMASHGEGASDGLLGGTVMHVVRHALTPVAVVPAHAFDGQFD